MDFLNNKIILITGGTGSFGNAVLNKFINSNFKELRIFSRDEKKQNDMRLRYSDSRLKFIVGDVRDFHCINSAMRDVDFVFHAAALKQVPSCEFFPLEAVKTNILGASNTIEAACQNDVEKLIVLSTDKAVYPINAMGMSKALMEKLMIASSRNIHNTRTIMCGTRYGNVMASRGSVIPVFTEQILSGKKITITNPDMTRFLMSLEDSVNLVVHAFSNIKSGNIFVQKSPASTILDLAEALMEIFNKRSEIKIIGTRHGEKLYETLLSAEEMAKAEDQDSFFRIPADSRDLNYDEFFEKGDVYRMSHDTSGEYNSHNTQRLDVDGVINLLMKLPFIKSKLND
tara:strand:+ start:11211 stop:12236 length:1026 start_codon:yes stop_codon:yes gene_type:complete